MPQRHWVLLRGLARGGGHWGDFVPALRRQRPQDRVTVLDLPGNGSLVDQISASTVDGMVLALRGQLAAKGEDGPITLLGLSLGGMVAAAWADRAPQQVEGLVLVNTSMRPFGWPWQRMQPAAAWQLLCAAALVRNPRQLELLVHRLTSRMAPRQVVDHWVRLREHGAPTRSNVLRQLWAAARFTHSRAAPKPPVLLMASAQDQLVSVRCSELLAQAWSVPLLVHDLAGHDLPLDDGPWVLHQIQVWLKSYATKTSVS